MKVLVYGWYGHGNLGDELFKECFKKLFPTFNFIFTDHITVSHLQDVDAVFFGGGSFLIEAPHISEAAIEIIKKLKIFYIGVGSENNIHPIHEEFIRFAQLIAIRNNVRLDVIKSINKNVIVIPDLVYSLTAPLINNKIKNSLLVIPNILVVPKWNDPHWKHSAWEYFKIEMAQLLDEYLLQSYRVDFLPMCVSSKLNDQYAAIEIINRMNNGSDCRIFDRIDDIANILKLISNYDATISQRYHGTVLSQIAGAPCVTIHHHDKLKNISGCKVSYYGMNKSLVANQIIECKTNNNGNLMLIDRDIFKGLVGQVLDLLK